MNRMKLAQECVEIDEAGGNVRDFLRMRGFISPWGTWYRLQIEELGRNKGQITEGKGGNDMKRVTLEQKKKAVEIALGGGDPLAYLKSIGSKQPPALWYAIRKGLQDADPAAYEKLMGGKPAAPKNDTEEPKPATCCAPSTRKGVEVPDEIPKPLDGGGWEKYAVPAEEARPGIVADVKQEIRPAAPEEKPNVQLTVKAEDLKTVMDAPVSDAAELMKHTVIALEDDFRIYGLLTKIGDFQAAGGNLCWYKSKQEMVSMPVEDWKKILEVVPKVMAVMGL